MKLFALILLATLVVGDRFYQQPYSPVVLKSPWQLASSPINRDLFLYPSQINNWVQYVFSEYFSTPVPVPDPVIPTMPDDDYIRKNPGYFSVVHKFEFLSFLLLYYNVFKFTGTAALRIGEEKLRRSIS
jgi:hypothetical protein